jgi:hypothetical protein
MPITPYVLVEGQLLENPEATKIENQDLYLTEPTPGPQGPQGEPGNSIYAWPIHSVFFTDAETTNPNTLLGFGTWLSLGKVPSVDAWGWKRTE